MCQDDSYRGKPACDSYMHPVMKRIHEKIRQRGEMVFIDSSGNCDRQNHHIFLLLTHTKTAGGLPLGCFITTSENKALITAGLQQLKTVLPVNSFHSHKEGPQVFMSDDCSALRQSLHTVFPEARCLLCVFHILQAMLLRSNIYMLLNMRLISIN